MTNLTRIFIALFIVLLSTGCLKKKDPYEWKELSVKATAYNSLRYQTSPNPSIAAWGDSLKPGMKCIAVSRDLIRLGLRHNTPVKIEGLEGIYWVKDKMHRRKKNKIDVYMGVDITKAKEWGVQRLKIKYGVLKDPLAIAK